MLFIYTAGDLGEENPSFVTINVNHAANSSVNYHWERNKPVYSEKQFHEKTPRFLTEDDTSISLLRNLRLSQGKEANRNKKKKILEGYTT